MNKIRLLMVDDHRMFLQGMRTLIEMEADVQVVGECTNGYEAVEAVLRLQPDVVLMDINMPGLNGVDATRQIMERRPETGIIILTMYREDAQVFHAIKNGARGYILKDVETTEVVRAIRAVARGESMIDPSLATRVLTEFKRVWQQPGGHTQDGLTDREVSILRLIAAGHSNKEIGAQLCFAEKTIKNYITGIFQKLQLSDRTQAAVYAVQHGLVEKSQLVAPGAGDYGLSAD
jgi:two-component system, NarL family, response regulator LiaR